MKGFNYQVMEELTAQQVRFAPPKRRLEQLARAEKLIAAIEPEKHYPYPFICFRITEFRPDLHAEVLLSGNELRQDLYLLIDHLAKSLPPLPVETVGEPVLTVEDMSKRFNVSTKTINRWRRRGLVGVPVVSNGRRLVGFLPSFVEPFLQANHAQVERGSRFSQLSEIEKDEIIRRARRLSGVRGGTLTEISRRIARRLNRSAETIRYTIKNFDRKHPDKALFPTTLPNLDDDCKQTIFNSYRRGINVDALAKQFGRNRTSVYRIINEVRARRLLDQPLDYIYNPSFDDRAAEAEILKPMPDQDRFDEERRRMRAPKDVSVELAALYDSPLLTKAQEQHLFRKMNFLKHKASKLRARLDPVRAKPQQIKQIEDLQVQANAIKKRLVNCNMRLAVSVAKKHAQHADAFFEILSDSNLSLLRAVEKFDYSFGFKFSTYATWSIIKNFARTLPQEKKHRERYLTGHDELFDLCLDNRGDEHEQVAAAEQNANRVNRLLAYLEPRERQIVEMRAGLDNSQAMTLGQIGERLGLTKERVRQINVQVMNKLRAIAREQKMDQ